MQSFSLNLICAWLLLTFVSSEARAEFKITDPQRNHWAFQPIKRVEPPNLPAQSPIDRFILARLEEVGLKLAASATKEQIIRRVTLDLTGLPPTPTEIQ